MFYDVWIGTEDYFLVRKVPPPARRWKMLQTASKSKNTVENEIVQLHQSLISIFCKAISNFLAENKGL